MYLTPHKNLATLYAPLTHSKDGIETPHVGDKTPLSTVVFLCPVISNTGLIRILSFMVGCIEQPFKRLTVPMCGSLNLIQSTAQDLRLKSGGLFSNIGHKPMNSSIQKPLNHSVSSIKDPQTLDNILNEVYRMSGTCQFTDKNVLNYGKLSRVEVESLIIDAKHLINTCNKALRTPPPKRTLSSRFNVLAKDTRQVLASRVTFEKAIQCRAYEETVIKFAGMVGGIA